MAQIHQRTTTKQRQIEFMWHLQSQGFMVKEIAKIYGVSETRVIHALDSVVTKKIKR